MSKIFRIFAVGKHTYCKNMGIEDVEKFVAYCKSTLDFTIASPNGYSSAPICALDAIFSLGVRYGSVVNALNKFCKKFKIDWTTSDIKTSVLLSEIEDVLNKEKISIGEFAELYLNKTRTSTHKTGILKADAFLQALSVMKDNNIETCYDAMLKVGDGSFESAFTSIPGQTYGTSLHYFYMLCGDSSFIKIDRHISHFTCQAICKDNFTKNDITELFQQAVSILKESYPEMTPKQLDHIIWSYMSKKSRN